MHYASWKVGIDHFQITVRSIIFFNMGSKIIYIIYFQIKCILYGLMFAVANQFSHPTALSFDYRYFYS